MEQRKIGFTNDENSEMTHPDIGEYVVINTVNYSHQGKVYDIDNDHLYLKPHRGTDYSGGKMKHVLSDFP